MEKLPEILLKIYKYLKDCKTDVTIIITHNQESLKSDADKVHCSVRDRNNVIHEWHDPEYYCDLNQLDKIVNSMIGHEVDGIKLKYHDRDGCYYFVGSQEFWLVKA